MVELNFGPHRIHMYYQTCFKVAAGILMAAKNAARYEGVHPSTWSEILDKQRTNEIREPLSRTFRRTQELPNFTSWSVAFDHNLVTFKFDDLIIQMHFGDAFRLYGMVRVAGKNAKRWAGDTSRQWTTRAHLADAEENDKFVYVN